MGCLSSESQRSRFVIDDKAVLFHYEALPIRYAARQVVVSPQVVMHDPWLFGRT